MTNHTHTHTRAAWSHSSGQDVQTWMQTAGAGELASRELMLSGKKGLSGALPLEGGRGCPLPGRWQDARALAQAPSLQPCFRREGPAALWLHLP